MTDAKRKVLDMVASKKITAAEGDALLAAMQKEKRFSWKTLFDPFDRFSTGAMLAIGAVTAVLSVLMTSGLDLPLLRFGGVRFDGFMDVHAPRGAVGFLPAVTEQIVVWPLAALALWLVAFAFERKSRFVDFLATTGVARSVLLLGGALIALIAPPRSAVDDLVKRVATSGEIGSSFVQMLPIVSVALIMLGWFIAALVFAFRHASGLRGGRLAVAFIVALIAAEVATKLALLGVAAVL